MRIGVKGPPKGLSPQEVWKWVQTPTSPRYDLKTREIESGMSNQEVVAKKMRSTIFFWREKRTSESKQGFASFIFPILKDGLLFEQWPVDPGYFAILYIGWNPTQVYGDGIVSQYVMECQQGFECLSFAIHHPFCWGWQKNTFHPRLPRLRKNTEACWKIGQQRKYDQFGVFWMACICLEDTPWINHLF